MQYIIIDKTKARTFKSNYFKTITLNQNIIGNLQFNIDNYHNVKLLLLKNQMIYHILMDIAKTKSYKNNCASYIHLLSLEGHFLSMDIS